ncbi:hypothetical protein I5462_18685 [Citrobacter freundii]|nr:hypothetical protein [Citrobacter freundii]
MQPGALEALADNAGDGKDNRSGDGDNGAGSGVGDDQGYSSSGDDEQDNKEKKSPQLAGLMVKNKQSLVIYLDTMLI